MKPSTNPASMRLFYALWPDEVARSALSKLQQPLRGRQTRYANLHITLAFLGEQPIARLPMLKSIVNTMNVPEITLTLDRFGYFSRQKIAWIGMHAVPDELHALQQNLVHSLEQQGVAFDKRSEFKPHITLARDALPPEDLPFDPITWRVKEVALLQSVLEPHGLAYRILASQQKLNN